MYQNKMLWIAVGLLIAIEALVTVPAFAGTVSMDFAGVGRGRSGFNTYYKGASKGSGIFAGQLKWDVTSSSNSGISTGTALSFCADIFAYAQTGAFDIVGLENAPDAPELGGSMGAIKAAAVNHLYSNYYDDVDTNDSSTSKDNAAAFQIAIWEIVNEDLGSVSSEGGFDLDASGGDFHMTGSGLTSSVRAAAEGMLDDVYNAWQTDNFDSTLSLVGLIGNGQDQIMVLIIPVPPAVWLMSAGLPAVLIMRRMRGFWAG